jgi:hypothetical protein
VNTLSVKLLILVSNEELALKKLPLSIAIELLNDAVAKFNEEVAL